MLTHYNNRATDVHQHDYRTEHEDASGKYQVCQSCGFRRHKRANHGIPAYRPWWVHGENWERGSLEAGLKMTAAEMEQPKRRGWPPGKKRGPRKRVLNPPQEAP